MSVASITTSAAVPLLFAGFGVLLALLGALQIMRYLRAKNSSSLTGTPSQTHAPSLKAAPTETTMPAPTAAQPPYRDAHAAPQNVDQNVNMADVEQDATPIAASPAPTNSSPNGAGASEMRAAPTSTSIKNETKTEKTNEPALPEPKQETASASASEKLSTIPVALKQQAPAIMAKTGTKATAQTLRSIAQAHASKLTTAARPSPTANKRSLQKGRWQPARPVKKTTQAHRPKYMIKLMTVTDAHSGMQEIEKLTMRQPGILKRFKTVVQPVARPAPGGKTLYDICLGPITGYALASEACKALKGIGLTASRLQVAKCGMTVD